ncbi:hypothetical protein VPH35_001968 [Triticum aestivum]
MLASRPSARRGRRPTRRHGTRLHQISGHGNRASEAPRPGTMPSSLSRSPDAWSVCSSSALTTLCVRLCCARPCPGAEIVPWWLVPCNCKPTPINDLFPTPAFISA